MGCLIKERTLNLGSKIELTWADGMEGVCPVFSSREAAEKYAGTKYPVWRGLTDGK